MNWVILQALSRAEHFIIHANAPAKSKEGVLAELRYAIKRLESDASPALPEKP